MGLGYMHAAFESLPGNEVNTPTLSTKVIYFPLITASNNLNPSPMSRDDELRNVDEPLAMLEEAHDPSADFEARAYPDLTGFSLKMLLGAPVSTAGNGIITDPDGVAIPTGVTRHVWTSPFGPVGITPQTTQLQFSYVDEAVFYKQKGFAPSAFSLDSPAQGGVRLKWSGNSLYRVRQSDPGLSASYESLAVRPFTRANLTLSTWLASTAVHDDFNIQCANPVATVRSLGVASRFPDIAEKDNGVIAWTGSVPQRLINAADEDALKAATGFAATAKWVNDSIIASSYPYKLFTVMSNCQYTGGGVDPLSNTRRIGATFNWAATNAGSASVAITLCNATASYA